MDLDSMKYAELRSLAKELGLKANMKADKLLKTIRQHYQKQKQQEGKEPEKDATNVEEDTNATKEGEEADRKGSSRVVFVNTRRGKGTRTKRKISDTETVAESDAKAGTEVAEESPVCEIGDAKRRRVSFIRDTDKTEADLPQATPSTGSEQQPDIKAEAPVSGNTDASKVARGGRIPRYERLQKSAKPSLNPVTPNFKKLHEAHFNKMESIDSYFERKTKKVESYRNAVKEVKILSDKTKLKETSGKVQAKANPSRTSMLSPAPVTKRPAEDKRSQTAVSSKSAVKDDAAFRPSVLSTRRINVRFSQATYDNEKNKSLVKTPARMSNCVQSSTPKTQTNNGGKPSNVKTATLSATKTPGPFLFSANPNVSTTPGTQKKPNFDLKASLSRPLGYKPHKGKLKAFGEPKENTAVNKSVISNVISNSHQKNYKQHQVQTRESRRAKHTEDRRQKKENLLGARRGLVMM